MVEASFDLLLRIEEAARSGDWDSVAALTREIPATLPQSWDDHADYLFRLRSCLITARMARADLVKSLHRLSAAAGFMQHP